MEWVPIVALIASIAVPIFSWYRQQSKLEGIFETRDRNNEDRLKLLEEQLRQSDSRVLAQRVVHSEIAIEDLEDWRKACVNPYVPAQVDRLRDRVDAIEREIGSHETGLRGASHRNSNKLTEVDGRISEIERRLKLRNERQDRR